MIATFIAGLFVWVLIDGVLVSLFHRLRHRDPEELDEPERVITNVRGMR